MGEDYLYTRLRNFSGPDKDLEEFQELKNYFDANKKDREKIEYLFAKIGKSKENMVLNYIVNTDEKTVASPYVFIAFSLIFVSLLVATIVLFINGSDKAPIALLGTVFSFMVNLLIFSIEQKNVKKKILGTGYLGYMIKKARQISKYNLANRNKLKELSKDISSISFWANFRLVETIDVSMYFISQIQNTLLLPLISYAVINRKIGRNKDKLIKLYMELGKIEAAISCLNYEKYMKNTEKPIFSEEKGIFADEVYHPLIEEPVGNPVNFDKVYLVTGSNASGKSTYVKSIALNAILAQSLNLVHAKNFRIKQGHVLTSMAIRDDVSSGDSYFIAEIKSLKRIVNDSLEAHTAYYFIDEILKGTNTVERIAASSAIIENLISKAKMAFVATHDIELTNIFEGKAENIHFRESVDEYKGISFDYKLHEGPSKTTNAIKLLKTMGFPSSIVNDANARVELINNQ